LRRARDTAIASLLRVYGAVGSLLGECCVGNATGVLLLLTGDTATAAGGDHISGSSVSAGHLSPIAAGDEVYIIGGAGAGSLATVADITAGRDVLAAGTAAVRYKLAGTECETDAWWTEEQVTKDVLLVLAACGHVGELEEVLLLENGAAATAVRAERAMQLCPAEGSNELQRILRAYSGRS
jgi:hypothetical protein